jgi:uncharacterized SAM-binding protein YcdF (DUF218 family)
LGLLFIVLYKYKKILLKLYQKTPKIIKPFLIIGITVFLLSFVIIEGFIIHNAQNKNTENAQYVIILGAGLNGTGPSLTLLQRINTAIEYLNKNNDTTVVVSGGRGFLKTVTEAEVMAELLQRNGIQKHRIILEDRSTNTYENLLYSGNLIYGNKKTIIVSSEFHLFRAKSIAKRIGYTNIGQIASKTPPLLVPNYYVREYLAVIKEVMIKKI